MRRSTGRKKFICRCWVPSPTTELPLRRCWVLSPTTADTNNGGTPTTATTSRALLRAIEPALQTDCRLPCQPLLHAGNRNTAAKIN